MVTASAVVNIAAFLDKIIKVQPDDKVQPGQQKEVSEGQQKYQVISKISNNKIKVVLKNVIIGYQTL